MVLGTVFAGQKIYLHRSVNCHWICVVGITIVTVAFYHVADYSMTKIAFLMDPIESIAIKKDSTLAMIRAAQLRGLEVYYFRQEDLMILSLIHI